MATKKQKVTNVPNLRFPGFEGDWYKKELSDFIDVITGIPLQSEDISEDKSGIPILRGINITEGFIRHSKEIDRYYPKDKTTKINKYLLEKGDLVIGMDGSKVGKNAALISQFDVGSILIQRVARVRALGNANTNYIFQKVFSKEFQNYVDVVNTSSGIPHISLQQIKDFKTGFPPDLSEQEKIAAFLTLIDERITTQNKIIEKLKTLMKGLREKLFAQKLRFKDENCWEFPEWEQKTLGDMAEIVMGQSPDGESYNVRGVGTPLINGPVEFGDKNPNRVKWTTKSTKLCMDNDILFCVRGSTTGKMNISNGIYCIGRGIAAIRSNRKSTTMFLEQQILENLNAILGLTSGSTFQNIDGKTLREFKSSYPSLKEQTKIANFLSYIDNKVDTEKRILMQYETQKNYLLQSMFV